MRARIGGVIMIGAMLGAGCGAGAPPVAVHAPTATEGSLHVDWSLTQPTVNGRLYIARWGDDLYVLACGDTARVSKIAGGGELEWTRELEPSCYVDEGSSPIAADPGGVIVATPATVENDAGLHVTALDRTGAPRWTHTIKGWHHVFVVAAASSRVALCFDPNTNVLELDGKPWLPDPLEAEAVALFESTGALARSLAVTHAWTMQCAFDDAGELWLTSRQNDNDTFSVDGVATPVTRGTWAFRLTGVPRAFRLYADEYSSHQFVPSGFVVRAQDDAVSLVDHDGAVRWRLAAVNHGCEVWPDLLTATPDHARALVWILCGQRGGTAALGNVAITDRTLPDAEDLGERSVLVDLDPLAGRATRILAVDASERASYVEGPGGRLLAFGYFAGSLGYGTDLHSGPPSYTCQSTLPLDAETWSSYPTKTPSCRRGFHLERDYPSWPFLVALE